MLSFLVPVYLCFRSGPFGPDMDWTFFYESRFEWGKNPKDVNLCFRSGSFGPDMDWSEWTFFMSPDPNGEKILIQIHNKTY